MTNLPFPRVKSPPRFLIPLLGFLAFVPAVVVGDDTHHPVLDDAPKVTRTTAGLYGDPINVGLVATKDELVAAMLAAKWQPADPITFKSSVKLVQSVMLHRPDETAPVSHLYLWKRREDLAFQQQVGKDASRRHHVRFWQSAKQFKGRSLWLGAATFDTKVGFSHKTGLPTHHIDANIDAERDKLMKDLMAAGRLLSVEWVEGFQQKRDGRNGGGDPYHTDGRLSLGILKSAGTTASLKSDPVAAIRSALPKGWAILKVEENAHPPLRPTGRGKAIYLYSPQQQVGVMQDKASVVYIMPADYDDGGADPTHGQSQKYPAALILTTSAAKVYLLGNETPFSATGWRTLKDDILKTISE